MNQTLIFDESFGNITVALRQTIRHCNVSVADWDSMFARWGFVWGDVDLPFDAIERHIVTHSQNGSYHYPLYGD